VAIVFEVLQRTVCGETRTTGGEKNAAALGPAGRAGPTLQASAVAIGFERRAGFVVDSGADLFGNLLVMNRRAYGMRFAFHPHQLCVADRSGLKLSASRPKMLIEA
jgi:hypothetical protein